MLDKFHLRGSARKMKNKTANVVLLYHKLTVLVCLYLNILYNCGNLTKKILELTEIQKSDSKLLENTSLEHLGLIRLEKK